MKINPLAVFTGLTLATLAALVVVEKDKWMGGGTTVAKVEPAPLAEVPKATETAKTEDVAKTEVPAAEAPKAEEVAKTEAPAEAPKIDAPAEAPKIEAPAEAPKIVPSFDTVRVEAGGESVIAGRAEPGAEVSVKLNGVTIGTAVANSDGAFVVTPEKPLPAGAGALSIETKSNDVVVASADTVAVDVKSDAGSTPLVAVLKPDEPTKIIQQPAAPEPAMPAAKTVNLDTVDYDQAGNIVFGGHGPAGSKVQIYVDNSAYGLATIGSDGTWSLPGLAPLAVGAHELRADEIGPDGAVKSRVGMPFYREDPTKVATAIPPAVPAQPTVVAAATEAEPAQPADAVKTAEAPAADTGTTTTVTEAAKAPEPVVAPATTAAEAPKTAETTVAATPEAPAATTTEAPKAVEAPAETPAATPPAAPANIIIQPGNNLWKLSRQIYGKGVMYTVIYEANKAQIRDADLIYPGQVFITPDAPKGQ